MIDREQLVTLYEREGLTQRQIAAQLGVGQKVVVRLMRQAGLAARRTGPPRTERRRSEMVHIAATAILDLDAIPLQLTDKISPEPNSGCWLWIGASDALGYGLATRRLGRAAHRAVYVAAAGSIPAGLELDHLCRTPRCCNPRHLEPVTHRVNLHRAYGFVRAQLARTQCPAGHPYDDENTYINPAGKRGCRTCKRARDRQR
jgi:hypothetical protein